MNHKPYSTDETQPQNVEERRMQLRNLLRSQGANDTIILALLNTLTPEHIRFASKRGIFISYDRVDELIALEISTALRLAQADVFMDTIDVEPGGDWRMEIRRHLKRCGLMIAVVSHDNQANWELNPERQYFNTVGKIIIPIYHEKPTTPPITPFVVWDGDIQSGISTIKTLLGLDVAAY